MRRMRGPGKRFLRASDAVLEEKTWDEIPEENRQAVEAAADVQGRSIEELRRNLLLGMLQSLKKLKKSIQDE